MTFQEQKILFLLSINNNKIQNFLAEIMMVAVVEYINKIKTIKIKNLDLLISQVKEVLKLKIRKKK